MNQKESQDTDNRASDYQAPHDPILPTTRQNVELDLTKYLTHIAKLGLSEDEQIELLRVICTIMQSFVDLGFGIMPPAKTCGQVSPGVSDAAECVSSMVKLENNTNETAKRRGS